MSEFTIAELDEIYFTIREHSQGKELSDEQFKLRASIMYKVNRHIALYNMVKKGRESTAA